MARLGDETAGKDGEYDHSDNDRQVSDSTLGGIDPRHHLKIDWKVVDSDEETPREEENKCHVDPDMAHCKNSGRQ